MPQAVNAHLEDWDNVAKENWPALLLGNGASIAVWQRFSYGMLFNDAPLTDEDVDIFDALGPTRNFEVVLDSLRVSRMICDQLGHDADEVTDRYESIKQALVETVNDVHVPWVDIPEGTLLHIGQTLLNHRSIYSTNYDLIVYWSLMHASGAWDFGDYFWQDMEFDLSNVEPRWDMVLAHYLHGGLHIYRTPDGRTVKRVAPYGHTLLDLLGTTFQGVDLPLFVSEGTSDDKMRVIRSSDYLSFVYQNFVAEDRPLVIFGNSLGDQDAHLSRAISHHPDRRLAVSIRPGTNIQIIAAKTEAIGRFPKAPIRFFDSTTHPLGDPVLQIAP